MRNTRLFFWGIIFLTILAIFIDAPAFSAHLPFNKINQVTTYQGFGIHIHSGNLQIDRDFPFVKGLDLE